MIDLTVAKKIDPPGPGIEAAFEINPSEMYPMVADHLGNLLDMGGSVPSNLASSFAEASALGSSAFDLVGLPVEFAPADRLGERAAALEVCRRFFTEALHASVGYAKMYLHILKDETFKLK